MNSFLKTIYSGALTLQGNFYIQKDPIKAITLLQNAVKISPTKGDLYTSLSNAYWATRNWERSIEWGGQALNLYPTDLTLRRSLGIMLLTVSRYREASAEFYYCIDRLAKQRNQYALGNFCALLGTSFAWDGQFEEAARMLDKAQEISPWDLDALFGRMRTLL